MAELKSIKIREKVQKQGVTITKAVRVWAAMRLYDGLHTMRRAHTNQTTSAAAGTGAPRQQAQLSNSLSVQSTSYAA